MTAAHGGVWEVRCTCGWEVATDHETHVWQLSRDHFLAHWVEEPPEFAWFYKCSCGWLSGWQRIRSELAAAVAHHRQRMAALDRWEARRSSQ